MSPLPENVTTCGDSDFYVVTREPGHTVHDLPTWASAAPDSIRFEPDPDRPAERVEVDNVPGAFQ